MSLGTGICGSVFYRLTGFHGLHVTEGAILLSIMLLRAIAFQPRRPFPWYRNFVDAVWLALFVFVYSLI